MKQYKMKQEVTHTQWPACPSLDISRELAMHLLVYMQR